MRSPLLSCGPLLVAAAVAPAWCANVRTIHPPGRGEVPEVVLDAHGVLHLVYGRSIPGNAFYVRSADGGKTFTKPVQLNRHPDTVTTGRERGPKVALGKDGVIQVLWMGYYKQGGGVFYTRSTDGGKTFSEERNLLDAKTGCDNATVAADENGRVWAMWTDGRMGDDADNPVASPIFMARSTDNGKTFSKNVAVHSDYPGRACGCCRLEAHAAGGNLYIAFRGGYKGVRDPYLLKGRADKNDFKAVRISPDDWKAD
jgi:hypothetical protein